MGWFDNDKQRDRAEPAANPAPRSQEPPRAREPRPVATAASNLGERVHVDGTIVSHEDLTVVGRVEGTIRAQETLRIAEEARVDAVIHGRRVLVQGNVNGDIHGSETVVLGPTAAVTGNIHTPALEIHDGGYFKGKVDMKSAREAAEREAAEAQREAAAAAARKREEEAATRAGGDDQEEESAGPEGQEETNADREDEDEDAPGLGADTTRAEAARPS